MDWAKEDALAAHKQGWGVSDWSGQFFRRRGFNRWKDNAEMERWVRRQAAAGDPLCMKAVAFATFKALTL